MFKIYFLLLLASCGVSIPDSYPTVGVSIGDRRSPLSKVIVTFESSNEAALQKSEPNFFNLVADGLKQKNITYVKSASTSNSVTYCLDSETNAKAKLVLKKINNLKYQGQKPQTVIDLSCQF